VDHEKCLQVAKLIKTSWDEQKIPGALKSTLIAQGGKARKKLMPIYDQIMGADRGWAEYLRAHPEEEVQGRHEDIGSLSPAALDEYATAVGRAMMRNLTPQERGRCDASAQQSMRKREKSEQMESARAAKRAEVSFVFPLFFFVLTEEQLEREREQEEDGDEGQ